jgi:hypothetical protein
VPGSAAGLRSYPIHTMTQCCHRYGYDLPNRLLPSATTTNDSAHRLKLIDSYATCSESRQSTLQSFQLSLSWKNFSTCDSFFVGDLDQVMFTSAVA